MSREIKVRVWSHRINSWLTKDVTSTHLWSEYSIDIFSGNVCEYITNDGESFNKHEDDSQFTIQQWTGLKDKNEKMIFEGDIMKITIPEHSYTGLDDSFTVREKCYVVHVTRNKWGTFYGKNSKSYHYSLVEYPILEVIGNIMENPELLEA